MGSFRRFVIGLAEFFQVISIIISTLGAGWLGLTIARLTFSNPYMNTLMFGGREVATTGEVVGFVVGAIGGFIVSATAAAMLFSFAEIAANTRETVELLEGARARNTNPQARTEPRL